MTDPLLAAILANPNDLDLRLVYADWLKDHNQEDRGAFIWDQVKFLPGSDDFDLLDRNLEAWCPWFERHDEQGFVRSPDRSGAIVATHLCGTKTYWSNGFIEELGVLMPDWLRLGPSIMAAHPVKAMRFFD